MRPISNRLTLRRLRQVHTLVFFLSIGIGFFYDQRTALADCSGDTSVSSPLVSAQANASWLCSYNVTNNGSISISTFGAAALTNTSTIDYLSINGSLISNGLGSTYGIRNTGSSSISSLVNMGTISSSNVGISNNTNITSLFNSGTISGTSKGIGNTSGTITSIVNSGTISSSAGSAIYIQTATGTASVGTITNTGSLFGATAGINNVNASLGTLNNRQGIGNANGALTYTGLLPNYYNVIIDSPIN
jgi:hypothetical protein